MRVFPVRAHGVCEHQRVCGCERGKRDTGHECRVSSEEHATSEAVACAVDLAIIEIVKVSNFDEGRPEFPESYVISDARKCVRA